MDTKELRKLSEDEKLIFGLNEVKQGVIDKSIAKVVLADNAPPIEANDIKNYAEMNKVKVISLEARNDQLGVACRKPFPVSFLAIKK